MAVIVVAASLAPGAVARSGTKPAQSPEVELVYPSGIALDRDGNLFISDIGTHRILKLCRERSWVTVFAGTGESGFSGDGGPAAAAQLSSPSDLAFDGDGNLLIADTFNHRIRRIDRRGLISTIVGNGKSNYGAREGPALGTSLNNPQGIAVGTDGTLFIADTYNHVVRRLDRAGTVSVFAGTEAGLAGDGKPSVNAQLNLPQAVAVAPDGSLYISDSANSRIRRVGLDGVIHTVAGSGPGSGEGGAGFRGDGGLAVAAKLFSASDLEFNALGQLYVSDSGNNRIRLIVHGVIVTVAGSGEAGFAGDGGAALTAQLNTPQKVALTGDGAVYVADRVNRCVRKIDRDGVISTVAGAAPGDGILVDPQALPTSQGATRR